MIEERRENPEDYQNGEEDIDDYITDSYKVNIKQDAGSSRHRSRIPVGKLKLENEADIPEKPKDILAEPNDKHYEKLEKEIMDQIALHNKNIEALEEQIKKEKFGDNPEMTKIIKEKDDLLKEREPVLKEIKDLEENLKKPKEELANLKALKDSLAKEIDTFKIEALNAEIKAIQEKLAFHSLTISEEKKFIDRKNRLQAQKPKVQKYAEITASIKALNDKNSSVFSRLKVLYESKKKFSDKISKLSEKIKGYYEAKKESNPKVNILKEQKNNLKQENDKLYEKKRELRREWNEKWRQYNDQQYLLDYIKRAQEKIADLKKREEREKKRREREEKLKAEAQAQNNAEAVTANPVEEDAFAYEIATCEWLISYFRNLSGEKQTITPVTTQTQTVKTNSKIDEDISKGLIKPMNKNDDDDALGLSTSTAGKKKHKGPKISKREQKNASSNLLSLDIGVIKKIKDVSLAPPVLKSDIPAFISQLEKSSQNYRAQADNKKNTQSAITVEPVVEPTEQNNADENFLEEEKTTETTEQVRPTEIVEQANITETAEQVNSTENVEQVEPTETTEVAQESAPETTEVAQESAPETTEVAQESAPENTEVAQESAPENTEAPAKEGEDVEEEVEEIEVVEEVEVNEDENK